jgi:hypothetical protein
MPRRKKPKVPSSGGPAFAAGFAAGRADRLGPPKKRGRGRPKKTGFQRWKGHEVMLGSIAAYLDQHTTNGKLKRNAKTAAIRAAAERFEMDDSDVWDLWGEYEPYYHETNRSAEFLGGYGKRIIPK